MRIRKRVLAPFAPLARSFALSLSVTIALVAAGCAVTDNEDAEEADIQVGSIAIDDAIDAAADDTSSTLSNQNSLTKETAAADTDITVSRTCSKSSDGVVTVTRTVSGSGSKTLSGSKATVTSVFGASGSDTRKWTPPSGQSIDCVGPSDTVKVNWGDANVINGLKTSVSISRKREISSTIVATTGSSTTALDNSSIEGTRTITWSPSRGSSGNLTTLFRSKSVTINVSRQKTFTKATGEQGTLSTTITSRSDAPLVMTVERLAASAALQKKTINSGTLVATKDGGGRIELTFTNVTLDYSGSNPCAPTSGSVKGEVYESGGSTATKTFTVTFGTDNETGSSIVYDNGIPRFFSELSIKGCDLEREK